MAASLTKAFFMTGGAVTVPEGVIVGWPSTAASIPIGWTRKTTLDDRYVKQIATSATNPGATGGSATHTHPYTTHTHTFASHTHSWPDTSGGDNKVDYYDFGGTTMSVGDHWHPGVGDNGPSSTVTSGTQNVANSDAGDTDPLHLVVIFIKSDGTPSGVPVGGLVYFNQAAPSGWTAYANASGRLLKGAAAAGNGGATGGSATHVHTIATHTHSVANHLHSLNIPATANTGGVVTGGNTVASAAHTHVGTSSSNGSSTTGSTVENTVGNGDAMPAWQKLLVCENTSGVAKKTIGMIGIWTDLLSAVPAGWVKCDGANGTPNLSQDRYTLGSANAGENGTTGGGTHTHAAGTTHTHTSGDAGHTHTGSVAGSVGTVGAGGIQGNLNLNGHSHTLATSGSASVPTSNGSSSGLTANSTTDPTFTGVAYIQYAG